MAKHAHITPAPASRRVAATRAKVTPPRRSPTCPAITVRLDTRGDVARLIARLINLLDRTEDTDTDSCAEDDVMLGLTHGADGPGDPDDAEPDSDDEDGGDAEMDFDNEPDHERQPAEGVMAWPCSSPRFRGPLIATVDRDGSVPALGLVWTPASGLGERP